MSTARIARGALKIPKYIPRGPTDILKALSSTVKFLPNQPPYVMLDDPYLLPKKGYDHNSFVMAKLSGKKTAKFILNKYPSLFFRDDAEPKVEDFLPREQFDEDMEFTENDIKWCIENIDPINGVIAYQKLEADGIKLDDETLMQFFELLCYTNEEPNLDVLDLELERMRHRNLVRYTWKHNGLAEKVFEKYEDKLDSARLYSAMIAGLARFNEHDKVKQKFEDFILKHPEKGLSLEAYDGLLQTYIRTYVSSSGTQESLDIVFKHMASHDVKPDLIIFNTVLKNLSRSSFDNKTLNRVFSLVNDMLALDIEPSLATYEAVIITIMRSRSVQENIGLIHDILNHIISNEKCREVRDRRDYVFCPNLMTTISRHLQDFKIASKVFRIFQMNPNTTVTSQHKYVFLNLYFRIMIVTCNIEQTMDFYKNFVGIHFVPNEQNYDSLIEALDLYRPDGQLIKRVWSDILSFDIHSKIRSDSVFRQDPEYVEALDKYLSDKADRENRRKNQQIDSRT